jgi:murein DD-endopeptidase MepM/ murein hydrolase activator NlpD
MTVKNQFYTIMFIPPNSKSVRKLVLSKRAVKRIAVGAGVMAFTFLLTSVFTYSFFAKQREAKNAVKQVAFFEDNLKEIENKLSAADSTLTRIQNFEQKLRVITRLEDSNRNLAMGPLTKDENRFANEEMFASTKIMDEDLTIPDEYRFDIKETNIKLSEISKRSVLQEQTMHELYELLQDQKALLTHTPSVWPVKGWLTSRFGYRSSPFTGRIQMHEGIDVASPLGTPILAPADGTVIRARTLEGYGKKSSSSWR